MDNNSNTYFILFLSWGGHAGLKGKFCGIVLKILFYSDTNLPPLNPIVTPQPPANNNNTFKVLDLFHFDTDLDPTPNLICIQEKTKKIILHWMNCFLFMSLFKQFFFFFFFFKTWTPCWQGPPRVTHPPIIGAVIAHHGYCGLTELFGGKTWPFQSWF